MSEFLVWKEYYRSISIFWIFTICLIAKTDDCDNKLHENPPHPSCSLDQAVWEERRM